MTVGRVVPGVLLLLAGTVAGCATAPSTAGPGAAGGVPRRVAHESDATADAYYQFTVAQMLVQNGRFKDAIPPMEEALRRDPNSAFLLAQLAIESEQWDEAISRLTRATELDPDHDGAWTALGYVYESQHRTDDAIETYRKAVKANPDNPAFVERLGDLLIRLERFQE